MPGRLCSTSALAALAGAPPTPEQLREAVRRDLLVEADERPTVGTGRVYRFKHVLIRDVAYSTLPKAERAQLHDRYGHWLEASLGDRAAELGDVIAFHAEQAALLAREVDGEAAPALGRRAFDLLLKAADRAWRRDDTPAAVSLYDRSIRIAETIDTSPQERLQAGGMAALLHSFQEAEPWLPRVDELIEQGRQLGPSETLAQLLMHRGFSLLQENLVPARAHLAEALSVARAFGDPETIATVWRWSRMPETWSGQLDEGERVLTEAIAYERANGLVRGRAASLCGLAYLKTVRGQFSAAAASLDEAAPLVEASRSRFQRAYRLASLALLATAVGDRAEALVFSTERLKDREESGLRGEIAAGHWLLGQALLGLANYEQAREELERCIQFLDLTNRGQRPTVLAHLAQALLGLGQVVAAQSLVEQAETTMLPWDAEAVMVIRTTAAQISAALDDPAGAEARFQGAIDGSAATQFDLQTALARLAFARFLVDRKRTDEARAQLVAARGVFSDPLAFRRRDEIDALLHECELINATG